MLPKGWSQLSPEDAQAADEELGRELPATHVLQGRTAHAFARREHRDDFIFLLDTGEAAVVHLTWQIETDPRWPFTSAYPSLADCVAAIEQDDA